MENHIRVFIVEDALFLREMLCRIFVKAGIEIVGVASSESEAFSQIETLKPDLIWVDLVLPGGQNGIALINKVKQLYPEIEIIACSSLQQKLVKTQSKQAGAVHFINKPFEYDTVLENVFSVMEQKEMVA